MEMLNRLYLALDGLTAKHGLFKVETIGDAYGPIAPATVFPLCLLLE